MDIVQSYKANNPPPDGIAELKEHREVPVHIHIPKCGGTFVFRAMTYLLRLYTSSVYKTPAAIQGAVIYLGGDELSGKSPHLVAFCFFSPHDFSIPKNLNFPEKQIFYQMPVVDFLEAVSTKNLDVFSMAVTSEIMARDQIQDLVQIKAALKHRYVLRYFTAMRPPLERAHSLYYVHKKRNPRFLGFCGREPSLQEFSDFVESPFSEPNWVSRFLAYVLHEPPLAPKTPMEEPVFEKLVRVMQAEVKTFQTSSLGVGLRDFFTEVYSPYIGDFALQFESQSPAVMFNRTNKKLVFKPSDLCEKRRNAFTEANSYDIALFNEMFRL